MDNHWRFVLTCHAYKVGSPPPPHTHFLNAPRPRLFYICSSDVFWLHLSQLLSFFLFNLIRFGFILVELGFYHMVMVFFIQYHALESLMPRKMVFRAVARALIGEGGGVYIHIFVFCPTNFF